MMRMSEGCKGLWISGWKKLSTNAGLLWGLGLLFFTGALAWAQVPDPGASTGGPTTIYHGTDLERVDVSGGGNLRVSLSLLHLSGRGLDTDIVLSYNSKAIWSAYFIPVPPDQQINGYIPTAGINGPYALANPTVPAPPLGSPRSAGWSIGVPRMGVVSAVGYDECPLPSTDPNSSTGCATNLVSHTSWNTTDGEGISLVNNNDGSLPTGRYASFDGSFAILNGSTLIYKDGVRAAEAFTNSNTTLQQTLTDTDGNTITCNSNMSPAPGASAPGGTLSACVDTLGRQITFTSDPNTGLLQKMTYLDSSGNSQNVTFSYSTYTVAYPLAGGDTQYCHIGVAAAKTVPLLSGVTLANGLSYQFQYHDNGNGTTTAEIGKIILPTGGYIRYIYDYALVSNDPNLGVCGDIRVMPQDRVVTSRIVSPDGTAASEQTWSYSVSLPTQPIDGIASLVMKVTDPLGDSVAYARDGNGSPGMVHQIDYRDPSGKVVKSVRMPVEQGTSGPAAYFYFNAFNNPRPKSMTTVWSDTNQQAQTTFSYGAYNNVTEMDESDWGAGAPGSVLRKTAHKYLVDSTPAYAADNVHIVDRVAQETVSNAAGTTLAQISMAYDGGSLTATSNVVQHDYTNFSTANSLRGNLTQVSRWLNTTGASLTTTNAYNDVGNLIQTTDPNGNVTSYSYTDNYANGTPSGPTSAFATQVTRPATNGVSHMQRSQYYFNTSLTAARCGENFPPGTACSSGLTGTQPDYSSFTYDAQGRPLSLAAGDGGQTTFTYNEAALPISIASSTKIDSTKSLARTSVYDGLGRLSQTQLNSDPNGVDYVDRTYDGAGRLITVSNPHRSASLPTDGVTQTRFDSLDRITQITKQDGSVSTSVYTGNCTTGTDEAGKQRKACTDALGRLIEVDEPGDQFSGTANTGTLNINGALQSTPATASTGSVTINGTEQCYLSVCQTGTVSISFNNGAETDSVSSGSGASASTMAANLASAINNCGHPPCYATAAASGATVTFTSTAKGTGANWPVATSYNAPASTALWSTKTVQTANSKTSNPGCLGSTLPAGQNLLLGQCLSSPSGRFVLVLQTAGNLVLYDYTTSPWTVLWATPNTTIGVGVDHGYMQSQGNFVLYAGSTAIWSSPYSSAAAYYLTVQDDGNAVIYRGFPRPSFGITPAQQTMSGGTNTYDSGTVTVAVGGFTASAAYGQGSNSTAQQVAQALAGSGATGLNRSGSPVTAVASGSSINLTSVAGGAAGQLTVTATATTSQAQSYSSPSFCSSSNPCPQVTLGGGLLAEGPSLDHNFFVTQYSYDPLGNLLGVTQKGDPAVASSGQWRVRSFTYDSLSRLLTANNPESGTISYQYDADGNLLQKNSAAPNQTGTATQIISYCYDALNRLTGRAYSAQSCSNGQLPSGTAVDTDTYDQGTYGIGHLTSWSDQAGTGSYTFDPLGRMTGETRTINGVQKSMSYSYNLDGSLKTLTYPSGAVITYTPDAGGRVLSAVDIGNAINYATVATYDATGGLTGFVSGNSSTFAGITNAFSYNNRLQPVNISATLPSATVFSLNYDFHVGAGDNGNVFGITNNKDTSRNQSFTYDALNRLTSAQNAGADCTQKTLNSNQTKFWGNNYSYDAWGNLLAKSVTKCSAESLSLTALANNQLSGYGYDAAGNMTHDATSGLNYSYDQENRITGAGGFSYTYDAEGNRVEKSTGGSSPTGTLYWYMAPGIVAESDLSGNLQSEYAFFDGKRVARRDFPSGVVSYYFSDQLKTTDVVTDAQGNIKNESDFYPWGGQIQFTNSDSNHYKFTGKERDSETQLDYFGARYYSNALGRFITPDWAAKAAAVPYADLADPQSLNLYSYVRNRPLVLIDPDGHQGDEELGKPAAKPATKPNGDPVTTRHPDGSSTTVQSRTTAPETVRTASGAGTLTTTTTYTTTTTTQRDADGKVTEVAVDTTKNEKMTLTDSKGKVIYSGESNNQPVSHTPLTDKDLKPNPLTPSAKLNNRSVADDADLIPVAGPYLKRIADIFGVTYSDVRKSYPNIGNEGCGKGSGSSCR